LGPSRAAGYGFPQNLGEYAQEANAQNLLVIQIEDIGAVPNLDAILAVRGIDVALIGPGDLSKSMGLAGRADDPRVRRLVGFTGLSLEHKDGEGNGATVIYKNPGIREGLSDLPWHRDCGMGGHSLMCPTLIASVYLTPATPETGELRFLPGSQNASVGFADATDPRAPRGVSVRAEPGDVTLHFGDVMHAAPPPAATGLPRYRTSAIVSFAPPASRVHRGKSYNEALHRRDDGQIEHLARVAKSAADE
jgi:hypothetical protein